MSPEIRKASQAAGEYAKSKGKRKKAKMDWGASRGASVRATVLTTVSVELNGRGGCEI